MGSKRKITISWSGGKDSALALSSVLHRPDLEIAHIHTVIGKTSRRVGLHGVREELIDRQAELLGLPVKKLYLDEDETTDSYETLVNAAYKEFALEGVTHIVFGDIFLEDLKAYRERLTVMTGIGAIFPLWGANSRALVGGFIEQGFKSIICSANQTVYEAGGLGRYIDNQLLAMLPSGVDACGENGEYHSFVVDGPILQNPVTFKLGSVVSREYKYQVSKDGGIEEQSTRFYFQDLLP